MGTSYIYHKIFLEFTLFFQLFYYLPIHSWGYKDNPDPILLGNTKLLDLHQLYKKNSDGIFEEINCGQELETLGLGVEENDAKEVTIKFVPSSIVKSPEVEHEEPERSLSSQV